MLVYDPFMGSGSTALASISLGQKSAKNTSTWQKIKYEFHAQREQLGQFSKTEKD
jgi:DNA modification methylase